MRRALVALALGMTGAGLAAFAAPTPPSPAPEVKLWRLDCGSVVVNDLDRFSDTRAYVGQHRTLAASCYLIRHGDAYMLWDTGLPESALGHKPDGKAPSEGVLTTRIGDELAALGVKPEQVSIVGISHYHFDHTGQAARFPNAKLLIGKGDVDAPRAGESDAKPLEHWLSGGGALDPVKGDRDVFGDGSVIMLDMPGHTPGHHALLVKLAKTGPVLLSGDVTHFHENYDTNGVPSFNTNRADSLASLDRFKKLAANLHALVVIQHDPRDIFKLPAFPAAAE